MKKENTVTTTIRMTESLHELLFEKARWELKMPVGTMFIEAIKQYLTKQGYKLK